MHTHTRTCIGMYGGGVSIQHYARLPSVKDALATTRTVLRPAQGPDDLVSVRMHSVPFKRGSPSVSSFCLSVSLSLCLSACLSVSLPLPISGSLSPLPPCQSLPLSSPTSLSEPLFTPVNKLPCGFVVGCGSFSQLLNYNGGAGVGGGGADNQTL